MNDDPKQAARETAATIAAAHLRALNPGIDIDAIGIEGYAGAIDHLLATGQMGAAQHGLRHMPGTVAQPRYFDSLRKILAELPSADHLLPFIDDPETDVQIVPRKRAETVVLLFCGVGHRLGMPLPLAHRWLGLLPASLVYLRDFQRSHYLLGVKSLGADMPETFAALGDITRELGARRVLCLGVSSGVMGALRYGLALGAERVVAAAGLVNAAPQFSAYLRSRALAERIQASLPNENLDMRQLYAAAASAPRVLFVYGDSNWDDRLQAEHMAGLPCVELQQLSDFSDHNVALELVRRGLLERTLQWLVRGT